MVNISVTRYLVSIVRIFRHYMALSLTHIDGRQKNVLKNKQLKVGTTRGLRKKRYKGERRNKKTKRRGSNLTA